MVHDKGQQNAAARMDLYCGKKKMIQITRRQQTPIPVMINGIQASPTPRSVPDNISMVIQVINVGTMKWIRLRPISYITIEILSGTLRGVGDAWMPLIMTGVGVCCLRVIWIIFFLPQYRSILAAAFCYPMSWTITSVAFVVYYFFLSSLRRVEGMKWFRKKDH